MKINGGVFSLCQIKLLLIEFHVLLNLYEHSSNFDTVESHENLFTDMVVFVNHGIF